MKTNRKILSLLLALAMIFTLAVPALAEDPATTTAPVTSTTMAGKTVILHSNDVHGAVEGYAYMAALKAEFAAKGADVIVVDAGDFSQGTTYVSTTKGADAVAMMNAVGYDFATLGNHEFDFGWPQLQENMKSASFKVLCADVFDADGKTIFEANAVVEKDGVKIGFFGLETPEAQTKANPALIKGLKFAAGAEMFAIANDQVIDLKAKGADIIICLSHLGIDEESTGNRSIDMLAKVNGIDMIIDGHSHTTMTKGNVITSDGAVALPGSETIQSTGTAFANIGVIVIDNATKAIEDNYLVAIGEDSAKDDAVAAEAQKIVDRVKAEYGKVFAKSEVELNGDKAPNGNRDSETNLGDLITDAMLWTVLKDKDSVTVPADNVVAITNGGGIRAWIHKGDISKQDVNTVLPFGNTVAVVYVTGAELLEALEASTYCTPTAVGGFPQVAGIDFTVNALKEFKANAETYPDSTYYGPASINRVVINSINGKAFDAKAVYAVVTNNFCAAGGDTYYAFAAASAQFDTGIPLDEALMSYITEELGGVVGAKYAAPQGRITVVNPFDDVKAGDTFDDEILWCFENGYMIGYADNTFRALNNITRAQICEILYRLAGCPTAPVTTDPVVTSGVVSTDPVVSSGVVSSDPVVTSGVESTNVESSNVESTDPATSAPASSDPATTAPASSDPVVTSGVVSSDPVATDPVSTDPVTTGAGYPDAGFTDADEIPAVFVDAINWAKAEGIMKGYYDGSCRPNAPVTREEFVTLFYRYVGSPAVNATALKGFKDASAVKADFVQAMCWAVENGIIEGYEDGNICPQGYLTRGAMSAILYRYYAPSDVVTSDPIVTSDPVVTSGVVSSDPVVTSGVESTNVETSNPETSNPETSGDPHTSGAKGGNAEEASVDVA